MMSNQQRNQPRNRSTGAGLDKIYYAPEQPTGRTPHRMGTGLKIGDFGCLAEAMAQEAKDTGARLFLLTYNPHLQPGTPEVVIKAACKAVQHLATAICKKRRHPSSWLREDAGRFRPRCILVPEKGESWHVHGLLLIPPAVKWSIDTMMKSLRTIQGTRKKLHKNAVKLDPITDMADLERISHYMTKNWTSLPPEDRIITYATYGESVSEDYRSINERAKRLLEERRCRQQAGRRQTAIATEESLKRGHAARCATAKKVKVTGLTRKKPAKRPYRTVVIPPRVHSPPAAARRVNRTGLVEWDRLLESRLAG